MGKEANSFRVRERIREVSRTSWAWGAESDETGKAMDHIAKQMDFDHLDFGVGLYPTLQMIPFEDGHNTTGTVHFNYGA